MTKKEELLSDITKIEKGLKSDLEEKFKISLREVLAKKQKELADLKEEKPAEKKASAPAPAKKVSAPAKKEDSKKSAKSVLDNCKEILRKHNKDKATAKSRIEKRKKQGKPAQLTPSETVKKTAQVVKAKVVDMKDKGLSASEIGKLADGIIATIKSTFAGIKSTSEKHLFLANLKKEISYLDGHLSKVAEYGGMFADGGMMAHGGELMSFEEFKKLPITYGDARRYPFGMMYAPYIKKDNQVIASIGGHEVDTDEKNNQKEYTYKTLYNDYISHHKKYEVGGALDGLMGDINAPVQNVGGTLFSTADLTSHLDFNANPMFKDGGMMAHGGSLKDRSERDSVRLAKQYQILLDSNYDDKEYEKYKKLVKDTQIPKSDLEKIENYVITTPKGKRRDIDIYRYWGVDKMAQGGLADYYEKKKYKYEEGGLTDENTEMLMSQIKEIKHHAEEIENLINNNTSVEAWVVAKAERSATDLSDITHYIDGKKETFAEGGEIKWQDVNIGDSANVKAENKTGVIVHTYGRKFNVKFVDGTEKTYDASELEFFKDDEDMFKDGGRFNEGRAWTLDHYQHNKDENYEVPTKDRVYADGGKIGYEIEYKDSEGDIFSDSFDTLEQAREEIKKLREQGYRITETWKYQYNDKGEGTFLGRFADGGRFNEGRAWTLDHYQHNKDENYEVPTNDRKYDDGGSVNKNLFLGDILEFDGKKYKAVLGENGMVNFIDIATKDIIKTTNILWDVLYNEGVKVKHFTDSFEHGGDTDDSKKKELKEILSKDYETFVELLGENIKDPKFRHTVLELAKENKIKTKVINVECLKLRPTQNEISLEKSLLFPLKSPSDADRYLKADHPIKIKNATILTCDNGEYIIDGHHRWSQVFVLNPKAIMSCTDFYQLKKPFVGLKATQLGISADLGYLPTSNVKDINMLKVSEADLKKYVTDNITDEVREVFKKNGINNPEEHIWKNVQLLKTKNKPVKGASKRDYMPQTDMAENFEKYTPNVSKLKKGGMSDRQETQENNFGVSYKLGDKFVLNRKFSGAGKELEVSIVEIMPSGLFFKVDKSDKLFSIKTLHSKGSTYTSGEYLIPKMAKGGSIENFNPKSLIGKHFYSNTNSGKITDVNVISNNNIKVKFETSSGTLSIEQSFTKKELFDMNNGKTVAGKGISKMAKGGMTTFADKVKAIAKKHLKNKKVSPSVQKDYGKTYNKQEALDSAKRIVGAMRKKEMLKKKVKINTDGFQNLDTIDFDSNGDMVVDNA